MRVVGGGGGALVFFAPEPLMEKVQSGSALTVPSLSVRNDTAKRRHLREKTVGPGKAVEGCRGSPRCSDLRSYFLIHHSLQVDERSERHPGQQPKVQLPFCCSVSCLQSPPSHHHRPVTL